jgi:hypothetical protein
VSKTIECLFKAFRTAGFNLSDPHVTDPARVERLLVLVAQVFGNTGVLVIGTVRICLEQDSGSSDGLGGVLASSGEAGEELALLVGQGDEVSFHLVSVMQSDLGLGMK